MNRIVMVTKSDGTRQAFEEEKLVGSLRRAGAKPDTIDDIVEEMSAQIEDGMTTAEIYSRAFALLHKHSAPLAVTYSVRRAMMELGPDGFPFEKFVARIFSLWGYETVTDQTLRGHCVEHEIDVVAWKGDRELAMIEAKYHNESGLKSDLKVALYVKARFDDLATQRFSYGGKDRALTERWLVTNTKFTDRAIAYGECSGLKLLGWNYPDKGNLHDIIQESGLQPISSMTSLSRAQKGDLIGRGILACVDIVGNPANLTSIGVKGVEAEKAIAEAQMIIQRAK